MKKTQMAQSTKKRNKSGTTQILERLGEMDKRFEKMDERFDNMDKRFDGLEQRFVMDMSDLRQVFTKRIDNVRIQLDEKITKLDGKFVKLDDKIDRLDARDEIRFKQLQTATLQNSRFIMDVEKTVNLTHEDVNIVKSNVKDIQEALSRHDTTITTLKKAVGHT